jgi:ssRNA-specific RNase YbeY (16S rRNA maturation enzyme)
MIVNLQRKIKLNVGDFQPFVEKFPAAVEEVSGKEFSIAFVSDRRMKELNLFFRGKEATTDVLSFPHQSDEFESSGGMFKSSGREGRPSGRLSRRHRHLGRTS